MLHSIQKAISKVKAEFVYNTTLKKHARDLPLLTPGDRALVDRLKSEGVVVTSLKDLGLSSTSKLLAAAAEQLNNMDNDDCISSDRWQRPQIYTVTDLAEFNAWGIEERLVKIAENYIGLPITFQGVHLRRDFSNPEPVGTQLWHKDGEDRRILKILIYLSDVSEKHGPFEYIPKPITSSYLIAWWIYYKILRTGFLGLSNAAMKKIVPASVWQSCLGTVGTVIFVDTQSVFHHGTLRQAERSTLFFVYTAKHPKRPDLCTQYSDETFVKPKSLANFGSY